MRIRLLLLAPLLLSACAAPPAEETADKPVAPRVAEEVQLSMDIRTWEDELATQHSSAVLRLTGAAQEELQVFEGNGTLMRVDPSAYEDATVVAVWSAWWAGAGDDIRVRRTGSGITVEKRSVDEADTGGCRPWQALKSISLPLHAELRLVAAGETVPGTACSDADPA